ncbi:MAG: hypothetical protein KBS70_03520 [Bacteroidales bacterium]|nr:hypothetical protein [Candidatus Colicola equi]
MANISVSLNLQAYKGFKYMVEKDQAGNKTYYAAIPVKQLFNPSGTTKVYATAVMIPTPNSEYSDFMLKPMCSAKELQSMSQDDFKALPVLGTGKYMEKQISKDLMKEAHKSATVDENDLDEVFGMVPPPQAAPSAPTPTFQQQPFQPTPLDTPNTIYYICDNGVTLAQARTWNDAAQMFKAQMSPTTLLYKFEGDAQIAMYTKTDFANLRL